MREENRILPNGVESDGLSILMVCEDGTLTLKVQAVFPYRGVSKAYIHEVTVRDTKDGGIQYVGNRIIEPINNPEIRWHVPRLTRTEWEELYGDN